MHPVEAYSVRINCADKIFSFTPRILRLSNFFNNNLDIVKATYYNKLLNIR